MIDRLKMFFNRGALLNAIEIVEESNIITYNLVRAKLSKGILSIVETFSSTSLNKIQEKLSAKEPVYLTINTPSILTKIIDDVSSSNKAIVNRAFPNIDFSKFKYEILKQKSSSIVSVCRIQVLENITANLKKHNIIISNISIGISRVDAISKIINENKLQLSNVSLELLENDIIEVNRLKEDEIIKSYVIADMTINNSYLLGFSNILSIVGVSSSISSNLEAVNESIQNSLFNRRFFYYISRSILGFLLLLLLVNFLVFNYYFSKNESLKLTTPLNNAKSSQLSVLKESVNKKELQVKSIFAPSHTYITYVFDDIAKNIPSDIQLTLMEYQPNASTIRNDKPIIYSKNSLVIKGETISKERFNNWIEVIEKKDVITNLEILNFTFVNDKASTFSIKISLKNEIE
ncbi:hypothetical protein KZY98_09965 [Croceibacter atlanticus]|uniref:hypothetical protein n=1 Tax=Croceibacter atlanticus TaxID=313588 RepID=UPI001C5E20ED|nr:hypothetical protein [Croceibacter atlanticus]MBW4970783.1 hypothetical protein [Croceibacter atlanticus]